MPTRRQYSLRVAPLSRYPFTNAAISSALRLRPMPLSQQHSRPTINRGCSDAYREVRLCLQALRATTDLPASERGPVESWELRRFASILELEGIEFSFL